MMIAMKLISGLASHQHSHDNHNFHDEDDDNGDDDNDKVDIDGLITDRVVRYCCQNKDISEIKTSNNPVKKTTARPLAGVSR